MVSNIVKESERGLRGKVYELVNKHGIDDPEKNNAKRDRFLALLKKQYGYTNEKAVDELERLLKQFYRTNKSLGIHHPRPNLSSLTTWSKRKVKFVPGHEER
jgi:hypothetical protein